MNHVKRFLAVFLSFTMAISLLPVLRLTGAAAEIVESGACGDTAAYTLDEDGNLVITGTGSLMRSFSDRTDIKTVVISDGITSMWSHAFARCTELTSVRLPDTLSVIPFFAFNYCLKLTEVHFPSQLTDIEDWSFASCGIEGSLILPDHVRTIGMGAFNNCQNITDVYIPASVEIIGEEAFQSNSFLLQRFDVAENNPYYCSPDGCLYTRDMTKLLRYASPVYDTPYEIPDTVSDIDATAFAGAYGINGFSVSEDHPYFHAENGVLFNKDKTVLMFYPPCSPAAVYQVPGTVTALNDFSFNTCSHLQHILLPDSLTSIGECVFGGCGSLKSIRLPDGVETIGSYLFNWCTSLKEITLSAGLKRIDDNAFAMCTGLESVYFLGTEDDWNRIAIEDNDSYQIIAGEEGGDNVLSFGNGNEAIINATVYFTFAKGDVDLDGHVTPADARMILRGAVGLDVVSFARSDLNNDGDLTPADARLAMRVCAFLEDSSSMECATPGNPTFTEFEGGADKITVDASFEDDTMTLSFAANDFANTTDGEMFVGFDPERLEYISGSVTLDSADADWEEAPATITQTGCQDGVYTFAFFFKGRAAAEESGLVSLTFRLLDADFGTVNYGFGDWNGTAAPAAGSYPVYEPNTAVIEYNGHYYEVFNENLVWADAKNRCEEMGGHLVSITTPQENAVIARLSGGDCWIGAECYDGAISWVTDEEAVFDNWSDAQPDNAEDSQHWVCLWEDGAWDDDFADNGHRYACEWESAEDCPWEAEEVWQVVTYNGNDALAEGSMAPQVVKKGEPFNLPGCGFYIPGGTMFDHWDYNGGEYFPWDVLTIEEDIVVTAAWRDFNGPLSLYEGHRYAFIPGSYNWETAEAICESMGGHLATVTSEAENDNVSLLAANGISWIGATYENEQIEWVTGEEVTYTNWNQEDQDPDNITGNQFRLRMYCDGSWDDYDDTPDEMNGLICEWDNWEVCPFVLLSFDGNGAVGEMGPIVVRKGTEFTLPYSEYEWPEGLKLHGWQIGDETYLECDSVVLEEDATATAIWGDFCGLTSSVTVDAAENVATLTISARNFVNTRSGKLTILYDNTQAEFLDAETTVADGFNAAWSVMTEEEAAQYDSENENRRGVTLSFFFTDAAHDEDFDLITLRFRLLPGKVATFYSSSVEWDGYDPWSGDLFNTAFGRPEKLYSYNGHTYALIDGTGDMDDPGTADYHSSSETLCELVGGHLATITTEQENAAVRYTSCRAGEETETYARTGGSYHDGAVSWITGEAADYVMWGDNTPEVEGNLLMIGFLGGFWEVTEDSWSSAILCEWEPGECPWEADKILHTVGFDGSGAEGEMRMRAVAENDVFTLPECDFAAPENKSFGGWALNDDVYAAEDVVTVSEDTVFTAVWNDVAEEHTEHEWDEGEVTTPPTCTEAGVRTYTCVVCGDTREEAVAATGHAWGEWTVIKAATCEDDGMEERVCANDSEHFETKVIPMSGHTDADHDGHCDACRKDVCKYCGKIHPANFVGRFIQFFHNVAYFFAHLFGRM